MQIRVALPNDTVNRYPVDDGVSYYGVLADVLIPGRGEALKNGALVVKDSIIEWVGPKDEIPSKYSSTRFSRVPVLMPHVGCSHSFEGAHVAVGIHDSVKYFMPGTSALIGAVIVDDLRRTLMVGFTSIRELCGYAGDVAPAIDMGAIVGPRVYPAIGILSMTGGHGDPQDVPLQTVLEGCAYGSSSFFVCAKVIKVCATGGALSLNDQPEDTQFSPEELRAIVQEAKRSSRVVAAHAHGKPGLMATLDAGVKSIEHGVYLDEEVAVKMKEKDAILVPTRHIVEGMAAGVLRLESRASSRLLRFGQRLAPRIQGGTQTCEHGQKCVEV
ncbi:hypothetical protein QBC32DRAFT_398825 [Pseudoneurospora amorphoporcata]|uniref:Amidohydrolase-related domain-containing protein n=1 Tax=Pseudoneurospora amorphoporcata TaxID=241081 RepID=A0AAN6NUI3_9PEZI|nr:hypothetical protein QBC32DRAFT_398825 [Pseudoneurospora amorphoporcata]